MEIIKPTRGEKWSKNPPEKMRVIDRTEQKKIRKKYIGLCVSELYILSSLLYFLVKSVHYRW